MSFCWQPLKTFREVFADCAFAEAASSADKQKIKIFFMLLNYFILVIYRNQKLNAKYLQDLQFMIHQF